MVSVKESVFPLKENGLPQPFTRLRNDGGKGNGCAKAFVFIIPHSELRIPHYFFPFVVFHNLKQVIILKL